MSISVCALSVWVNWDSELQAHFTDDVFIVGSQPALNLHTYTLSPLEAVRDHIIGLLFNCALQMVTQNSSYRPILIATLELRIIKDIK